MHGTCDGENYRLARCYKAATDEAAEEEDPNTRVPCSLVFATAVVIIMLRTARARRSLSLTSALVHVLVTVIV